MGKKKNPMKCGFCNTTIDDKFDFPLVRKGRKTILTCPHCNAILGIYYA